MIWVWNPGSLPFLLDFEFLYLVLIYIRFNVLKIGRTGRFSQSNRWPNPDLVQLSFWGGKGFEPVVQQPNRIEPGRWAVEPLTKPWSGLVELLRRKGLRTGGLPAKPDRTGTVQFGSTKNLGFWAKTSLNYQWATHPFTGQPIMVQLRIWVLGPKQASITNGPLTHSHNSLRGLNLGPRVQGEHGCTNPLIGLCQWL